MRTPDDNRATGRGYGDADALARGDASHCMISTTARLEWRRPSIACLRSCLGQPGESVVLESKEVAVLECDLHFPVALAPAAEPGEWRVLVDHQGSFRFGRA